MSNSLDPDQVEQFVGPDLGRNYLQWSPENDKNCHLQVKSSYKTKLQFMMSDKKSRNKY